jgi:hypothetical protein
LDDRISSSEERNFKEFAKQQLGNLGEEKVRKIGEAYLDDLPNPTEIVNKTIESINQPQATIG